MITGLAVPGPNPNVALFYTTLWIGGLLLAGDQAFDAFPDALDEVAAEFFSLFKPEAKA